MEEVQIAFENGEYEKCHNSLCDLLEQNQEQPELLFLRAKIYYNWQKWGDALNDLNRVVELDKNHQLAINYKKMVMDILSFWHKDSYNP